MRKTLTIGMMLSCTLLSASSFAQQYSSGNPYNLSVTIPLPPLPRDANGEPLAQYPVNGYSNQIPGTNLVTFTPKNLNVNTQTYVVTYPSSNNSSANVANRSRDTSYYSGRDSAYYDDASYRASEGQTLEMKIPKVKHSGDCYMVSDFGLEYLEGNPYCDHSHNITCGDSPFGSDSDESCVEVPRTKAGRIKLKPSRQAQCYLVEYAYGALFAITPIVPESRGGRFPRSRADDLCSRYHVKEDFRTFDAYPDFTSLKQALGK